MSADPLGALSYEIDPAAVSLVTDLVDIAQGLAIIGATIFTARWTYRTFSQKEKMAELKEFKRLVEER